ncbi:type IV pilus assembly protein PilM [Patescibacteria group bacterium]|nr:type IV pilus assembly protein PilM [Patescibacteria group bacterium]MBU4115713.1 type IV pilus assembly protein PilM [Patescibacteria group bacterium]
MSEFLNNIIKSVKDYFNKKEESVLGIDISSSSIKVVQLRKKRGKAILETYGEISLGAYANVENGRATKLSTQKITEALSDLLRESKVTAKKCGVAVPLSSSLLKIIKIPSVSERQLKEIVPIEARKYIPVPATEVLLDWNIIPKETSYSEEGEAQKADKIEVMIVAIHKEIINMYTDVLSQNNLESSFFEIELFATTRSVLSRGIRPVMIFDFGVSTTKLYVVEGGIIRESHIVNRGSQDLTLALSKSLGISFDEAEGSKRTTGLTRETDNEEDVSESTSAIMEYIFSEVEKTIIGYQIRYNKSIVKIILTGGGMLLKNIVDRTSEKFKIEVELANPFRKVEAPAFLEEVLKRAGPEFAVAVGIALRKLEEMD